MDRDSYTHVSTAEYINRNFVPVKVDYEQRPPLSVKLERAQAVMNFAAGLPLTAFVTPHGRLYFGATYSPAQKQGDKPAFRDVLEEAAHLYHHRRSEIERDSYDLKVSEEFREKDGAANGAAEHTGSATRG